MSAPLLLSDLPTDIVFSIFACCDIASVVSVSQTCRCLHALAFEKSVWLILLHDLRRRCILDRNCTPNLETLSTAEMIEIVRRLITGPQTWNPTEHDSVAEFSRKITLHPAVTFGDNTAKLLGSGRYILFTNEFRLQCWSVAEDRLVWTHTSIGDLDLKDIDHEVQGFAAEETDANLTIMVCIHTFPDDDRRRNYVEMINLDLRTEKYTSLLVARAPDSDNADVFSDVFYSAAVRGAIAAADLSINGIENLYMIINWKEGLYFIVQGDADPEVGLELALIPSHILLSEKDRFHLISSDVLGSHGTSTIGLDGPAEFSPVPVFVKDITKLKTIEASDTDQFFDGIYAHESPIRDGHYSFSIYSSHRVRLRDTSLSYRLSIPTNGEPQWYQRNLSTVDPDLAVESVSDAVTYSGHCLYSSTHGAPVYTIFSKCSASTSPRIVQVGLQPIVAEQEIHIAPYSGALTYFTNSLIVVQYYR
ncbi:hypothetical protein MSAN_01739400 [Mycena sanguinolenta]|uniref:F-box domain-containing protein n=1 Tax=Mycena sanguinolenta TaxID=230812 RepID=A0A8H6XZZ7_9AGAR|nr:hypothetical protein MSAN_01739400 [Mycena sanguinolenta]